MDKQYCKRMLEKGGRSHVRPTILKNIWTFSFNAKNGRDSSVFIVCWYTLLIFIFLQSRFNNIHVYFTFKIDTYKSVDCNLWFTILEFIQIKESLRKFSTSLFSWSSFV